MVRPKAQGSPSFTHTLSGIYLPVSYIYIVIVTRMTLIMGGESEDSLLGYEQIRKGAQLHPHETA